MISILFTNVIFAGRTGTEVATLELAQAMRARGHLVAIYSPILGPTATMARMLGIAVTSKIETIGFVPTILHGHHNVALAVAMTRFPETPAVFVCHDTANPYDEAPLMRRIGLAIAVDAACRDRLLVDGVPAERIQIVPNAVDLDRFVVRTAWSARPASALLIVKQRTDHLALVAEACRIAGVTLEVVGPGVGAVVSDLAHRCRAVDIVFAHSRSAIEAVTVGAAVILIDEFGYSGMFLRGQVEGWPETTLSRRILGAMPSAETLAATIASYDPAETEAVTRLLRARVDLATLSGEWEDIYDRAITNVQRARDADRDREIADDQAVLASFVGRFLPRAPHGTEFEEDDHRLRLQEQHVQQCVTLMKALNDSRLSAIEFRPSSLGHMLLGNGWYQPEEWGVWSAMETAIIWLPEAVLAQWDFAFSVVCARYMPAGLGEGSVRTVEALIEGQTVAVWQFTCVDPTGTPGKVIVVPPEMRPEPGRSVMLTLRVDRPISPVEAGDNADRRPLGIRLTGLQPVARADDSVTAPA